MLFAGELEVAANEDEHAAVDAGGLTVDGGDGVLALLEGEAGELGNDVLGSLDLLPLERQHRSLLVQARQPRPVAVERAVVVLHECLRQRVWIHLLSTLRYSLFTHAPPPNTFDSLPF